MQICNNQISKIKTFLENNVYRCVVLRQRGYFKKRCQLHKGKINGFGNIIAKA